MLLSLTLSLTLAADGGVGSTKTKMQEAFGALIRLQAFAGNPALLRDPKQQSAISNDLGQLKALGHAFPADAKAQEPATAALASLFGRYATETQRRFDAHDVESVGPRVRTLMSLCFTCHSRERAADFADAVQRIDALGLTGLERATVLASTRQFDAALEEYEKVLSAPITDTAAFSRAVQDSMTLLVRVKDDPAATMVLLQKLEARKDLPKFFRATVPAWKRDVEAWRGEKFDAQGAKPQVLFAKAQALVATANGGPLYTDERKDVLWLRASAYLNLALAKEPKFKQRGEALFLLGTCAAGLRSPLWWDVDELFFEACVRENPKTPLAKRCFERLSERVTLGFTGSAGTFIPDDELTRLEELKALSH
jgi:tetratricopeptide (TPR) repeat protein